MPYPSMPAKIICPIFSSNDIVILLVRTGVGVGVDAGVGTVVAAEDGASEADPAGGALSFGWDVHPITSKDNAAAHTVLLINLELIRFTFAPASFFPSYLIDDPKMK
ncbi:hypothetical protein [Paenibacillus planticolens]|uniref:hypothetical protein n=1 Tax=Paenibacillus planticolens TaxID=2654976 RepID=UPI001490903A|nr:hypothetical protein [Paenibacillus planticolens]